MSRRWPAKVSYLPDLDRGTIEYEDGHLTYDFQFQHGPTADDGSQRNGLMNEELIALLCVRLRSLNERFPCRENALAITNLEQAGFWLEHRQDLRLKQGVYGKNEAHTS